MKYIGILQKMGLVIGLISSIITFLFFYRNIEKLGTHEEWKYYFSLTGFVIFFLMFLLLISTIIIKKNLKNNVA